MRKLDVDLDAIASAMEDGLREFNDYYLDTQTGKVILLPLDLLEGDELDEIRELRAIADAIDEGVEEQGRPRYEWVPERESYDAYNAMVRFAGSVEDETLQRLLAVALDGRGAFRRFRDVLYDYPEERERWFQIKDAEGRQRATEWLRSLGIEPGAE